MAPRDVVEHCGLCGEPGHRRTSCSLKANGNHAAAAGPLRLRPLSKQERAIVFDGIELRYLETVREMEGGVAYGIPLDGSTPKRLRDRLNRAAEHLGLTLRWAPDQPGATEAFCELAE